MLAMRSSRCPNRSAYCEGLTNFQALIVGYSWINADAFVLSLAWRWQLICSAFYLTAAFSHDGASPSPRPASLFWSWKSRVFGTVRFVSLTH